jgi:hypothetical protein
MNWTRGETYIGNHFIQEVFEECRSGIAGSAKEFCKVVGVEVSALLVLDQIEAFLVEGGQRPLTCEEAGMFIVFCVLAQRHTQLFFFLHCCWQLSAVVRARDEERVLEFFGRVKTQRVDGSAPGWAAPQKSPPKLFLLNGRAMKAKTI